MKKTRKLCFDVSLEMYKKIRFYFPKHTGFSDKMRGVFAIMISREEERRTKHGLERFTSEEPSRNDG